MSCKILSNDKISDNDFLELMIKHHNVAVKMSQLVMMTSCDDFIIDFARKTIYNQSNEVSLMEKIKNQIPNVQNVQSCNYGNSVISTQFTTLYPNIFSNLKCKESHFDYFTKTPVQLVEIPKFEQVNNKKVNDQGNKSTIADKHKISDHEYVEHMAEHNKSGIDLAKLVIKSTKEPKILVLAQTIILEQEKDIFMIKNLFGCLKYNWRNAK